MSRIEKNYIVKMKAKDPETLEPIDHHVHFGAYNMREARKEADHLRHAARWIENGEWKYPTVIAVEEYKHR